MARFVTAALATSVGLGLALSLPGMRATAAPAGPELVQWLAANTDMAAAQVVISGPEYVYTLEPAGPRAATGEQVALVRTERLDATPDAASWEAHLLIDCPARRLRQIRGATFAGRNRSGAPVRDEPSDAWIQPEAGQPAMQLLAAACDPAFAWPLRPFLTAAGAAPAPAPHPPVPSPALASSQPQIVIISPADAAATSGAPSPPVADPADAPPSYAVQIARGPSEEGAGRALARARRTLGERAHGLDADVERSQVGERRRFTAVLLGFPTAEAADAACRTLQDGGQTCFVRSPAAAETPRAVAAAVSPDAFAVQVARGPSQEGAGRALAAARKVLGGSADSLADVIEESRVGDRRRFTAVLAGFPSDEATAQACKALVAAGQLCFTRSPAPPAAEGEPR